jgi:luciferase family oxidoreductase group 1
MLNGQTAEPPGPPRSHRRQASASPSEQVSNQTPRKPLFPLGALDASLIQKGTSASYAIDRTLRIAPELERLGYSRLWLTEHHNLDAAHGSPATLVAIIAATTRHLRVGSGGVLLNLHRPMRVAKEFALLSAVFPGRIDLGLARGRNAGQAYPELLESPGPEEDYESRVAELLMYIDATSSVRIQPRGVRPPEVWLLGSGSNSAKIAAAKGAPFSLSLFIPAVVPRPEVVAEYRREFQPGERRSRPWVSIAAAGVCAPTATEAARLVASHRGGGILPLVVGDPIACAEQMLHLQRQFDADEVLFLDLCQSVEAKSLSYALLAEAVGLTRDGTVAINQRAEAVRLLPEDNSC